MSDHAKHWQYTIKFCDGVDGQELKDVGVLQTGIGENNTNEKHIIGRISVTDIKTGSEY